MSSSLKVFLVLCILGGLGWGGKVLFFPSSKAPAAGPSARKSAVVLTPAVKKEEAAKLEALGSALSNESVVLTAEASKKVQEIFFSDGQQVAEGTLLLQLENDAERAAYEKAKVNLAEQASKYARYKELSTKDFVALQDLETQGNAVKSADAEVKAAEAKLKDLQVIAPFSGVLGLRRVSVGNLLTPGAEITTLDDISAIKVDFMVPEKSALLFRPGLKLAARSVAFPGRVFDGEVSAVAGRLSASSRMLEVRGLFPNPGHLLKPGMMLLVEAVLPRQEVLLVPEKSVLSLGEIHFVYLYNGKDSRVYRREVDLGERFSGGTVQITKGLEPGDKVVIEGLTRLADGAAVEAAP